MANTKSKGYQPFGDPMIFPCHGAVFHDVQYSLEMPEDTTVPYLSGETIYIDLDIINDRQTLRQWKEYLVRVGARVVDKYALSVTIVVVKDRSTSIYQQASMDQKTVASAWWLTNTILRRKCVPPIATLVDYPMPRGGIPSASKVFAISGYHDTERDYLRRLGLACGMIFSPAVSAEVTHLISYSTCSHKYKLARKMGLAIVNHLWLEESFQNWKFQDPVQVKYTRALGSIEPRASNPEVLAAWWVIGVPRPLEKRLPEKQWVDIQACNKKEVPQKRPAKDDALEKSRTRQKK